MLFNSGKTWNQMLALPHLLCNPGQNAIFPLTLISSFIKEDAILNTHLKALVRFKQVNACGSTFWTARGLILSDTNNPINAGEETTA